MSKLKSALQALNRAPDSAWFTAMILAGWAIRLYRLGEQSLWFDETFSWLVASEPLHTGLKFALINFVHPPLYYLLLHLVTFVSQSEFALRFPSAVLGTLSIPLIYLLGQNLVTPARLSRAAGLLAAALLASNPFHVWFSREVRTYSLEMLFAILSVYFFLRILRKGRGWIWFTLFNALGFLTHYFFLLIPLAEFSYFLLSFRQLHRLFRRWVLSMAIAFAPLSVWLVALFAQEDKRMGIAWITTPKPWSLFITIWNMSLLSTGHWTFLATVALPLFALALAPGLGYSRYRSWLILWLLVPPFSIMVISWILSRSFYVDRYFIIILPAYLLLIALGINRLPKPWAGASLAVVLLISSSIATARIYGDPNLVKEDWRDALAVVKAGHQPGDLIVVRNAEAIVPLTYYYPESLTLWTYLAPRSETDPWPSILEEYNPHRLWLVYDNSLNSSHTVTNGPPFDIFARADTASRNWLATHGRQIVAEDSLPGISVVLVDLEASR